MCPAEWSVLAYVGPGFPMLQTSRGMGLPGGIVAAIVWGIDVVVVLCIGFLMGDERGLLALGGLLGGLRTQDSLSDDVSGGVGNDCCSFLCLRASLLFRPALRLIASLLMYSVAGLISRLARTGFRAEGLATCARVGAFDISQQREVRGLLFWGLERAEETTYCECLSLCMTKREFYQAARLVHCVHYEVYSHREESSCEFVRAVIL